MCPADATETGAAGGPVPRRSLESGTEWILNWANSSPSRTREGGRPGA